MGHASFEKRWAVLYNFILGKSCKTHCHKNNGKKNKSQQNLFDKNILVGSVSLISFVMSFAWLLVLPNPLPQLDNEFLEDRGNEKMILSTFVPKLTQNEI